MTTYNPAEVERLVREAREDDAKMTETTWHVVPHVPEWARSIADGFPAVVTDPGDDGRMIAGCDSVLRSHENASGIARTRNNLRAMADQLEAAKVAIENFESMERASRAMNLAGSRDLLRLEQERDSATARIAQLEETARAACRQRDEAREEAGRLRTVVEVAEQWRDRMYPGRAATDDGVRICDAPILRAVDDFRSATPSPDPAAPGPRPEG